MRSRPRLLPLLLSSMLTLGFAACGGDDGDGDGGDVDADVGAPDADNGGAPDADPNTPDAAQGASALGQTCTGMGQGDCPTGFECLNLQTGNWCSKRCNGQTDPICADGYTGPGQPLCILGIDENADGMADFTACTVVCEETTPDTICTAGFTCDGTCPGDLVCNGPINNQNGDVVGQACQ